MPIIPNGIVGTFFIMANQTWEERNEEIDTMLSPGTDGEPIYSVEHRTETKDGDTFHMSFVSFEGIVNDPGTNDKGGIKDARLVNRQVSHLVYAGVTISSDYFSNGLSSDTLVFINGVVIGQGEAIQVVFKQQSI